MDPVTAIQLGVSVIGLGMKLFGGSQQSDIAHQEAEVSQKISGVEMQQNDVRKQAMEMSARRQQTEIIRNAQRMRAMAVQAGVTQTGNTGNSNSGLQGGLGEVASQGYYGLQGVNNQLSFGRQMFGLDNQLSQYRQQMASLQGQAATAQGWQSLGGSLLQSSGTIGNIGGQAFGGLSSFASLMSPGSLSGGLA